MTHDSLHKFSNVGADKDMLTCPEFQANNYNNIPCPEFLQQFWKQWRSIDKILTAFLCEREREREEVGGGEEHKAKLTKI
jgi:hypothetical protein